MSVDRRSRDDLVEALRLAEAENRELRAALRLQEPLRKQAADALSASEARYRRLVEKADEGIWTLDNTGVTDFVNPRGAELLGYRVDEMIGRPPSDFVFGEDVTTTEQEVNKNQRGEHESKAFRMRHKSGGEVWVAAHTAPIRDDSGAIVGALSMFTDVTARRIIELERDAHLKRLEEALTEIRRLREILPICSYCKKVRDDRDYWQQLEEYITEQTGSQFSHGICPDCMNKHFPGFGSQ